MIIKPIGKSQQTFFGIPWQRKPTVNTEQDMKKATGPIISVSFINTLHLDPNALLQRNKCASEEPKPYMKYKKNHVQNSNENVTFKKFSK